MRTLLAGSSQLPTALVTALATAVSGLPVASADGTGALTSTAAALAALVGSTNATVSQLGTAISGVSSAATRTALVSRLTGTVSALGAGDLTSVSGAYRSVPVLTVDAAGASAGSYTGTLTVTLVQP